MENKNITILWLDDQREPYSYFKKKKTDSGAWVRNNDFYQENIFNNYKPNFIWVKNLPEFSEYIIKNGLPDLVSFDHDLSSKTVKCDHNGADCARWLVNYCKENGLQMPKCFAHTANNKQRPILNDILGLNESIILESCDFVFNDSGEQCNATSCGAYPFVIFNGRIYGHTEPMGHGNLIKKLGLPKIAKNRQISICGRLFPKVNSDGTSILSLWAMEKYHNIWNDEHGLSTIINAIGNYFNINPESIYYGTGNNIKKWKQYKPNSSTSNGDIEKLLNYTKETAKRVGYDELDGVDAGYYKHYANKPYSKITPKEKEMFSKIRKQSRGGQEMYNTLKSQNPNFTKAQWNAMSTIGDSKIKKTNVITESQLRNIIKETILEYLRK